MPRTVERNRMIEVVIDDRYCKGCDICIHVCPKKILELSKEVNSRGYFMPYVIDASKCTKCLQCELLCPDFAIFIVGNKEGADE